MNNNQYKSYNTNNILCSEEDNPFFQSSSKTFKNSVLIDYKNDDNYEYNNLYNTSDKESSNKNKDIESQNNKDGLLKLNENTILKKVSNYESTNFSELKLNFLDNETNLEDNKSQKSNFTIEKLEQQFDEKLNEKPLISNKNNENQKLAMGKSIKDFGLFWMSISTLVCLQKEEKFLLNKIKDINKILKEILEFYDEFIFISKINTMKFSLVNEVS